MEKYYVLKKRYDELEEDFIKQAKIMDEMIIRITRLETLKHDYNDLAAMLKKIEEEITWNLSLRR